jgi:glutamate-1-semialdehyde aminotransferase
MSIAAEYTRRTPKSATMERRGLAALPIVSSRGVSFYPPYPVTMAGGHGPYLDDIDGNRYIDLHSNFFSLIHGNAYPPIVEAVTRHLAEGTVWPANNIHQVELAELITARLPAVERVLFCNSGTEAFSLALNLCRGATGRYKFLMAAGGYHGSLYDAALGSKGSDGPSNSSPRSTATATRSPASSSRASWAPAASRRHRTGFSPPCARPAATPAPSSSSTRSFPSASPRAAIRDCAASRPT